MRKIITAFMLLLFSASIISAQSSADKKSPLGKWKFEAPYAPEGFTTGIIEVSFADNKYSSAISFAGSDYIIPGDKTKIENDTVSFVVIVEGNEVAVTLKAENNAKMTGKAIYSEGEIPLTLTKDVLKN
jgi:DNA topoisomerase VI subunit A